MLCRRYVTHYRCRARRPPRDARPPRQRPSRRRTPLHYQCGAGKLAARLRNRAVTEALEAKSRPLSALENAHGPDDDGTAAGGSADDDATLGDGTPRATGQAGGCRPTSGHAGPCRLVRPPGRPDGATWTRRGRGPGRRTDRERALPPSLRSVGLPPSLRSVGIGRTRGSEGSQGGRLNVWHPIVPRCAPSGICFVGVRRSRIGDVLDEAQEVVGELLRSDDGDRRQVCAVRGRAVSDRSVGCCG